MIHGIRLSQVAHTSRAPARSMPGALGLEADHEAGLVGEVDERAGGTVSHSWISRSAFSPAATSVAPPWNSGSLAMTPTG